MATLDNNQAAQYTDGTVNVYEFEPGVCVLPIAEDPPTDPEALKTWSPVVILRLHAPYRRRTHQYGAYKQNAPPVIPKPADTGAFIHVGGTLRIQVSQNSMNSLYDWDVNSINTYVEDCVSRPQDGCVLGTGPWTPIASYENSQIYGGALGIGFAISGPPGAIRQAGEFARAGYGQSLQVDFDTTMGYSYNSPAFFPGVFFSDILANGGPVA